MVDINIEKFKKEWFTFEEIESIKRGLDDIENGRTYTEEEFYKELNNSLFSKEKNTYV